MNLNCPLNGVSCSLGVPVDVIETKPGHAHVGEVNAYIHGGKNTMATLYHAKVVKTLTFSWVDEKLSKIEWIVILCR